MAVWTDIESSPASLHTKTKGAASITKTPHTLQAGRAYRSSISGHWSEEPAPQLIIMASAVACQYCRSVHIRTCWTMVAEVQVAGKRTWDFMFLVYLWSAVSHC